MVDGVRLRQVIIVSNNSEQGIKECAMQAPTSRSKHRLGRGDEVAEVGDVNWLLNDSLAATRESSSGRLVRCREGSRTGERTSRRCSTPLPVTLVNTRRLTMQRPHAWVIASRANSALVQGLDASKPWRHIPIWVFRRIQMATCSYSVAATPIAVQL